MGNKLKLSRPATTPEEQQKWWLVPIIVVPIVFGMLILLNTSGSAPFIYKRF